MFVMVPGIIRFTLLAGDDALRSRPALTLGWMYPFTVMAARFDRQAALKVFELNAIMAELCQNSLVINALQRLSQIDCAAIHDLVFLVTDDDIMDIQPVDSRLTGFRRLSGQLGWWCGFSRIGRFVF